MKTTLTIKGMTCDHCAATVEKALLNVNGVEKAKVKLKKELAKVTYNAEELTASDLKKAVEEAGYQVEAN